MRLAMRIGDPRLREDLRSVLRDAGHEVSDLAADGLEEPLADPGTVGAIVDFGEPGGARLVRTLRRIDPLLGLVAIVNDADAAHALEARRAGADAVLRRPFALGPLERALRIATRRAGRPPSDPGLVARDPCSRELLNRLESVAQSEATLLLRGPSGSGRTRLARFVHTTGPRGEGPLVEVDCGALGDRDAAARLFGASTRGAPVGALRAASRGTLLLEDVDQLPRELQEPLLHALQERRVRPVGARLEVPLDVRLVATTGADLEARVAEGRFREDLRLRLGVLEVVVPALRDRPQDVPELAAAFLDRAARSAGTPRAVLDAGTLRELQERPFPGNLHELEALMLRAQSIYRGVPLRAEEILSPASGAPAAQPGQGFNLRRIERETIARSLRAAGGNRTLAARALGISTRTLRNKLRRYELV